MRPLCGRRPQRGVSAGHRTVNVSSTGPRRADAAGNPPAGRYTAVLVELVGPATGWGLPRPKPVVVTIGR